MKKYCLVLVLLVSTNLQAWNCAHEEVIEVTLDMDNTQLLSVLAGAGDLEIRGNPGSNTVVATGRVCASKAEWLDEADLIAKGGREASIAVSLPDVDSGWSVSGNRYVYMDLTIEVPDNIPLDVRDSSGDMSIESTTSVTIRDSSGNIDLEDINGDIVLNDSSGDIDLLDINGNVTVVQDSSGDVYGKDIVGMVLVERDSSGDIRFEDVRDDFVVERDSSGDIVARSVGGDFRVLSDSSGGISHRNVSGTVDIPKDKS
ncbi:MAG TPA: DUF4097 family beta strand repeat-containing protein [Xanthomonadales bacterium]|nr:DUF4097 family beta strand repeat-containing protein [Xanthomonadales bacterium]